jgi:hypothetical protein
LPEPPASASAAILNRSTNKVAIAGGVIAALLVLLSLAWFFLRRRKRKAVHEGPTQYPFSFPQTASIRSAPQDRRTSTPGSFFSPGARVEASRSRSYDGLSFDEGAGPTISTGATNERETEAQAESLRVSQYSSSNHLSTSSYPSIARIVRAIETAFHDASASAAEAATEAQAARSDTPANQHTPLPPTPPGSLQQPTATNVNVAPSVIGRISWISCETHETLPRYAEHGSLGSVSLANDSGGPEIGHSNPKYR